jgi:hypothetical protein
MGAVITVPQPDGEIVVTFPGRDRVILPVTDGQVTAPDQDVAAAVLASVPDATVAGSVEALALDVDHATVAEVNEHLDRHPDQAGTVLAAERAGRARVGILDGPHATPDPADEPAEED